MSERKFTYQITQNQAERLVHLLDEAIGEIPNGPKKEILKTLYDSLFTQLDKQMNLSKNLYGLLATKNRLILELEKLS